MPRRNLNFSLILLHPQDSDDPGKRRTNIGPQVKLFAKKLIFSALGIIVLLSFLALPTPHTQAGIFSTISAAKTIPNPLANSQTIGLVAALGTLPPALGGGDTTISGDALVAEISASAGVIGARAGVTPASDQISIYVVHEGDTLSQIAEMFGVSVNTIKWANDLPSATAIHEGQVLVILPVTGIRHTIEKGETLASIAAKYKGDADEIASYNGLEGGALVAGEVIIIPDGEEMPVSVGAPNRVVRGGGPEYRGYFATPLGRYTKTQGLHGYNGVDLAAPAGTTVTAAAAGQVIISKPVGYNGGYGNYVVIKHNNGTQTLYAHLSKNLVATGQSVEQGQTIGLVGSTGKSTGNHLHFEVRGAKNPF